MVKDLISKKQIYILSLLVIISIFLPTSTIVTTPHATLKDIVIIFTLSVVLSFIFLFIRQKKQPLIFFKSNENLLFFMGCSFVAIYFLPTLFAFIKGDDYFLDGFLPIFLGVGICISTIIYRKIAKQGFK